MPGEWKDELLVVGGKIYAQCKWCHKIIRINKPFFGSFHICLTEEEREAQRNG